MRRPKPLGLIGAGDVVRSCLGRLPDFRERLGPVKANSLRVARRIVNALRTGHAVTGFASLAPCSMILVAVGDKALDGVLRQLAASDLDLKHRLIVICETFFEPPAITSLSRRGAKVAGMLDLYEHFIFEGDQAAIRGFKRELLDPTTRSIILERGARQEFLAGLSIAASTARVAGAAGAKLRASGLSPGQSRVLVERTAADALRAWARSGQKAVETLERDFAAAKKLRLPRKD